MIVFVSPHFDDGIGSCGCFIHHLFRREVDEAVEVLTIFGGMHGSQVSEFAKELHSLWKLQDGVRERICENTLACQRLHAGARNLNYAEAIYRQSRGDWLYPNQENLFGPIHRADHKLPVQIADEIIKEYPVSVKFIFPAGKGRHADHIIVNEAGKILAHNGYSVIFYGDFSYTGDIANKDIFELIELSFCEEDLQAKIYAVQAYTSQLQMLFKNGTAESYYNIENRRFNQIYEQYYRIRPGFYNCDHHYPRQTRTAATCDPLCPGSNLF